MKKACIVFWFLALWVCFGDEEPGRKPRVWGLKGEGEVTATFVKMEGKYVFFRTQDGEVRKVHLWEVNGKDLAYLQRQLCKFPKLRRPVLKSGRQLLVDLDAEDLALGALTKWENKGALGGAFYPLNLPPTVEEVEGRKAVTFAYGPWNLRMEFQPMVADFVVPESIIGGNDFSVVAWLYNPGAVSNRETFLSWQPITGDDGTQLGYGEEGRYAHEKGRRGGAYEGPLGGVGFSNGLPEGNQWHHIAYTFSGSRDGELRIYIDGELSVRKTFNRIIRNLPATDITRTTATIHADLFLRDKQPVNVWAYVGERDNHHWRWHRWQHKLDLGKKKPGTISVPIKDLKPGTPHYFRFLIVADDEQRWSDGAGSFTTAGADGKLAVASVRDSERLMFLGCHWGSHWDWVAKPILWYTGCIASLKVYDRALTKREVRNLFGGFHAYGERPADGSTLDGLSTKLSWKPGADGVKGYRVYFGTDQAAVKKGAASVLKVTQTARTHDPGKLVLGRTYYWRVDQLNAAGEPQWPGQVWSFTADTGKAHEPVPADAATDVSIFTAELYWTPGKYATAQSVYFGADREAVRKGATPAARHLGAKVKKWRIQLGKREYGTTYYWRVEEINNKGHPASPGDVWSFTVEDYFELENDGPVTEPFPRDVPQDGYYGKYLEGSGHPVISKKDTPDEAMLIARKSCLKLLHKRPDVLHLLEANNCATHLSHGKKPWGWSEFICGSYGATRNMLSDPTFYWGQNMLVHEMGHQFHMFGAEPLERDFRHRLYQIYLANMEDLNWLGDYGANNMWEYVAVCASAWVNDGHKDDVVYPRDRLRKNDPRMYFFLNEYWPGDMRIELHPMAGLTTASDGTVTEWANNGGVEYWGKFGWRKYRGTVGAFTAVGDPRLETVRGATAVTFDGDDALVWNCGTRDEMAGNHEWSVELWAYKDRHGAEEEALVSWGPRGGHGAQFIWGTGRRSYDHGPQKRGTWRNKPSLGTWHHIVYVFKGGGLENGAGEYTVYVDGRQDSSARHKLEIRPGQRLVIGGVKEGDQYCSGFTGALAHVRIYDYDLSQLQVQKHYAEERGFYERESLAVAGVLLVDLDARALAPCPVGDSRPFYPKGTQRRWLRSWANRGILGGKLHNDRHMPEGSDPLVRQIEGITAVCFTRNDRMTSSFVPNAMVLAHTPKSIEAWVYRERDGGSGTIVQWGQILLRSDAVSPGRWQYVVVVEDGENAKVYVDGKLKSTHQRTFGVGASDRLHLGAAWNGHEWHSYFTGGLAQLRIHSDALSAEQIGRNYQITDLNRPVSPFPSHGAKIVAARREALRWTAGLATRVQEHDLYLGTDYQAVANARRGDKAYVGRLRLGQHAPKLRPGTTYYWRVDGLDHAGNPRWKGHVWSFATYVGALIDLDASNLALGKLTEWHNKGRSGGKFAKGTLEGMTDAVVETVAGRKGVNFRGNKLLSSSFAAPAGITGDGDFTLAVWAFNPRIGADETMVSWASRPWHSAQFIYGHSKGTGAWVSYASGDCGFEGGVPPAQQWHHIAWTYTGGKDGTFRVYADGKLNTAKTYSIKTKGGEPIILGAAKEHDNFVMPFSGLLAEVAIYDYPLGAAEVAYLATGAGARPDAGKLLVALDATDLKPGKLKTWRNKGKLGGYFGQSRKAAAPVVEVVNGRKAVTFDGKRSFLRSDFTTPPAVTGDNPFTVELWVHNPRVGHRETVFSMAPFVALKSYPEANCNRAADCGYGRGGERDPAAFNVGRHNRALGWKGGAPAADRWHHLAYVYAGGRQSTMKVYMDGELNSQRTRYTLNTMPGYPMHLGTSWNTATGTANMFSGSLARLKVYDYARTDEEVREAAGPLLEPTR